MESERLLLFWKPRGSLGAILFISVLAALKNRVIAYYKMQEAAFLASGGMVPAFITKHLCTWVLSYNFKHP